MKTLTTMLGVVGMLCCVEGKKIYAQTFTIANGKWSSPSTWNAGVVPDFSHGSIVINHAVTIPEDTTFTVDELVINAPLTIESNATVTIAHSGVITDLQVLAGTLNVYGKLICNDQVVTLTNASTTTFYDGSIYEHRYYSVAGEPPAATWSQNSTLLITGYTTSRSLNTIGWQQYFGNVIYNCAGQLSFVDMLGNLKNITGDFRILNTNSNILRLSLDKTSLSVINVIGDFVIEGNSEVWISRSGHTQLNVAGNFENRSTSAAANYITTSGNSELNVAGSVLMSANGAFRFASSGGGTGIFRIAGNLTMTSGRLAAEWPGIGLLEFNGNSKQVITFYDDVPSTITHINNNPSETELQFNDAILGSIQCNSGHLILPENFELHGNLFLSAAASFEGPETLKIVGTTNQQLDVNGETIVNLSINKPEGTTVTLGSSLQLSGNLSILSANTDFISSGYLTLLSQRDDGTQDASIYTLPNESEIVGDVRVQRYMAGEGRIYRYIASPVTNATVADLQEEFPITGTFENPSSGPGIRSNSPSFFYYDESIADESGWVPYPSSGTSQQAFLTPGLGYAAFIRRAESATVWEVTGVVNQGEITLPTQYHNYNDPDNDGWNLVGNPYPATIDWDAANGWEKVNIETGIYIRDNSVGQNLFWDGDLGSLGNGRIAKGQSFWIKTNGDNPLLKVNENAKAITNTTFYRSDNKALDFLELTLKSISHQDKTYLRLRSDASAMYDDLDLVKLKNDNLNITFAQSGIYMAVAATNSLPCEEPIPFKIFTGDNKALTKGEYTLQLKTKGALAVHTFELIDTYTQTILYWHGDSDYHFSVGDDSASFNPDRFIIIIKNAELPSDFQWHFDEVYCDHEQYRVELNNLPAGWNIDLWEGATEISKTQSTGAQHQLLDFGDWRTDKDSVQLTLQLSNVCSSASFMWNAERFTLPMITEEHGVLISSANSSNQWYENDHELVGETGKQFKPLASGRYSVQVQQDQCKASAFYDFVFQYSTLAVYPNPARDELFCLAPLGEEVSVYRIFDSQGKVIMKTELKVSQKSFHLNTSGLPAGVYLLEIGTARGHFTSRFVKQH